MSPIPTASIPRNSGCYRPIRIIAPPGSVVNVVHPGPSVGGNTDLQPKLIDLLLAALSQAVPDRVAASSGGSSSNLLFGGIHPETGRYYSNYHFDGMGAGGTTLKDGNDAEITRHSNCRNTPVEVFEHRYPLLTLGYGDGDQDSGGAGRHRGGLATGRTLRVTAPEITFSALFDRSRIAPTGLFGGRGRQGIRVAGQAGRGDRVPAVRRGVRGCLADQVHERRFCARATSCATARREAAASGPPEERDPDSVRADVLDGYTSAAEAERDLRGGTPRRRGCTG